MPWSGSARTPYWIDHTDNAQLMDLFTFGVHGGIYLGAETYGQLTNFNFDCVGVGIHKLGSQWFNRNWQIAQGSIIANAGPTLEETHPILIEGKGHTALSNVEAFSGDNGALSNHKASYDYMTVTGPATVTMTGCRMTGYRAAEPIHLLDPQAKLRAVACIDKDMYKPKPEPVRYCKYCGGRLSEIRTDGRKSWRHCFSCHFEFEVPADV